MLHIYFREGDQNHGRFNVEIEDSGQRKELFNITNRTMHPADKPGSGISTLNPVKLYTSDKLLRFMQANHADLKLYWDDFELFVN